MLGKPFFSLTVLWRKRLFNFFMRIKIQQWKGSQRKKTNKIQCYSFPNCYSLSNTFSPLFLTEIIRVHVFLNCVDFQEKKIHRSSLRISVTEYTKLNMSLRTEIYFCLVLFFPFHFTYFFQIYSFLSAVNFSFMLLRILRKPLGMNKEIIKMIRAENSRCSSADNEEE